MPVVGYLSSANARFNAPYVAALQKGLAEEGVLDGRNVEILHRYADYRFDRLPELATELVRRDVAVIAASGAAPSLAAKGATTTVPIVFECAVDPVVLGLVTNFNRPGGNLTGVTLLAESFYIKGLEFLRELKPRVGVVAMLTNPTNPALLGLRETEDTARALGMRLTILSASNSGEIEHAYAAVARDGIGAVFVNSDRLFQSQYDLLAALAVRYRVPAIYWEREAVHAGGLMSYGASLIDAHRVVGTYVARILKGDKPGDLPIQQPTRIEIALNLRTAKAIGLEVPTSILIRADEVIE
jgi:putative ABC transport system substrate-binding protein